MSITAYPLTWPEGWPRTEPGQRKYGRFTSKSNSGWNKHVTVSQACQRIQKELDAMDGPQRTWQRIDPDQTVVSTNLKLLRPNGMPRSDQKKPDDPGAALYFQLDGKRQCIPCDAYLDIAQNLAAIAATLSALRTLERHGSGIMERAFTGFAALPDQSSEGWWTVLGVNRTDPFEAIKHAYKVRRSATHPDKGGSDIEYHTVAKAWQECKAEFGLHGQ